MNSVSPVKTALLPSLLSSNRKQMLSWVWQGVCRARIEMLEPAASGNDALCAGVVVTRAQSRPATIGSG